MTHTIRSVMKYRLRQTVLTSQTLSSPVVTQPRSQDFFPVTRHSLLTRHGHSPGNAPKFHQYFTDNLPIFHRRFFPGISSILDRYPTATSPMMSQPITRLVSQLIVDRQFVSAKYRSRLGLVSVDSRHCIDRESTGTLPTVDLGRPLYT